ncbi:M50 family metallopeptidase [Hymenobacter tenuis]
MRKLVTIGAGGLLSLLGVWLGRQLHSLTAVPAPAAAGSGGALAGSLVLLLLCALLAIGIHELGHALLGRWQGFQLQWLTAGPFRWQREGTQIRLRWNPSLYAAGGLVVSVPTGDHDLRRRYLYFVAGGPLASVLGAGLGLGSYALLPPSESGSLLGLSLAMTGAVSGAMALMTLLPLRLGGAPSDGARLLTLLQGGAASHLELTVLAVTSRSVAGTRPRELPLAALHSALPLPDVLAGKPFLYHYLYLAALDGGQLALAEEYLLAYQSRVHQLPAALRETVWLEAAFFAAAFSHDLAASQTFQGQAASSALTAPDAALRVSAAQARLGGDAPQARAQAQACLRALAGNTDRGSSVFYTEWLHDTLAWAARKEAN